MIDRETWLILAERLEVIRWTREVQAEPERITLVFDSHDQARVLTERSA